MSKSKKFKWTPECDSVKLIHEFGGEENSDFFGAVFSFDGCVLGVMSDGEEKTTIGLHHSNLIKCNQNPMNAIDFLLGEKQLRARSTRIDPDRFSLSEGIRCAANNLIDTIHAKVAKKSTIDPGESACYLHMRLKCKKVFSTMDRLFRKVLDNKKMLMN